MNFTQIALEALRAMGMNKLRTSLTMLGIIIGVGAVVMMLAIGESVRADINQRIASMGSNLFIIFPGSQTSSGGVRVGRGGMQNLTEGDAQALQRLENVDYVAPVIQRGFQVQSGYSNWNTYPWMQIASTTSKQLHILNGLAGCAFEQVVDDGDNHCLILVSSFKHIHNAVTGVLHPGSCRE